MKVLRQQCFDLYKLLQLFKINVLVFANFDFTFISQLLPKMKYFGGKYWLRRTIAYWKASQHAWNYLSI